MKQSYVRKGMVLCAGLGTRLLPITEKLPKPLIPILNVENLLFNIHLLQEAGIEEIIVNLFHLPDSLETFLKKHPSIKAKLQFSRESVLLGTGGGVKKAEAFFEKQPFVLANCDFVTDVNLTALITEHRERKSLATMLLIQDEHRQRKYSKVGVDEKGQLCSLPKFESKKPAQTGIFTGIHVIEAECLKHLQEKPCGINDLMYPALMKEQPKRVNGVFSNTSFWYDTGEVDTFLTSTSGLLRELSKKGTFKSTLESLLGYSLIEHARDVWGPENLRIPSNISFIGPVLLGKEVRFEGAGVVGPNAVMGDKCTLQGDFKFSDCVVFASTHLKEDKDWRECLLYQDSVLRPAK